MEWLFCIDATMADGADRAVVAIFLYSILLDIKYRKQNEQNIESGRGKIAT